jgi:large subunit ribosomal protein L15
MELAKLEKLQGKTRKSKRVGRGIGSGKGGHTVGKGQKGQKSRSGAKPGIGFEGGQVPLYKRMPQLGGFSRKYMPKIFTVSLDVFNVFEDNTDVSPLELVEHRILRGLTKKNFSVKILGNGQLTKKLTFKGFDYSEKARESIEKSGSKITE